MASSSSPDAPRTTVAFGEVVRQVKDKVEPAQSGIERYVAGEHMETNELRIRRWGRVGEGYLGPAFHMRFQPGHVLYGSRRTYLRKVALASFEGITANTTYVLESKDPAVLLPGLLPFIMQTESFHSHSIRESKGSVNPYVNFSDLRWFQLSLPPINEQRRLVEVLNAVERATLSFAELGDSLRRASVSRMEDQLTSFKDRYNSVEVNRLLLESPRNGLSPTTNSSELGLKTVSTSAVSNGIFNPSQSTKFAEVDEDTAKPFFVKSDDVFVIRGNGNRYTTGTAGISKRSYDRTFYPDLLIRLRFDHGQILPDFAVTQWNLPSVHRQLVARSKSSNGIWKVNGQDIRAHRLIVPTIQDQKDQVAQLVSMNSAEAECESRRQKLRAIKTYLLERLSGSNEHVQ